MQTCLIPLGIAGVRRGLTQAYAGMDIRIYEEIDSTNNEAKRLAGQGNRRAVLLAARTQTAGRGRLGREFYSPPDTGLYMTLLWRTQKPLDQAVSVTAAAAVAASRAIQQTVGAEVGIKWVNDLYLNKRKVCGILAEAVTPREGETYVAVGRGINLLTESFPAGLRAPAGCLLDAAEQRTEPLDMGQLCGGVAHELLKLLEGDGVASPAVLAEYRRRLILTGQRVRATRGSEVLEGVVRGVDDAFGLVLDAPDGTHILHSGEISVRTV